MCPDPAWPPSHDSPGTAVSGAAARSLAPTGSGRSAAAQAIENNLSIANMDLAEFADADRADGSPEAAETARRNDDQQQDPGQRARMLRLPSSQIVHG
jgi:Domain of unknown function (DUF6924)